jgi:hypothetical protein
VRLERNQFQQLMHAWAQHHPYNAMDLVELLRPADCQALSEAVAAELQACGIAQLRDEPDGWHYEFVPGPAQPLVEMVARPADHSPLHALQDYATAQMNRPFPPGPALPVRFGVMPSERGHYVAMTYQHWLFDGLTAGQLFCRILTRYLGHPPAVGVGWCNYNTPPLRHLLRHWPGSAPWTVAALETIQKVIRSKQSLLPQSGDWSDPRVQVEWLHDGAGGLLERVVRFGRAHRASVNEVLSALVVDALASALAEESLHCRGGSVSVGGVADLRRVVGPRLADWPGMFLGGFYLWYRLPVPDDLGRIVAALRQQMQHIKRRRLVLGSGMEYWILRQLWRIVPASLRDWYFTRAVPLSGGLSNLHYPAHWYTPIAQAIGRYWRAVPSGPLTLLAVGVTTVQGRLSIALTTRVSGYTAEQRAVFRQRLLARLDQLG